MQADAQPAEDIHHESVKVNDYKSNMAKWLSGYENDLNAVLKGEQEIRKELEEILAREAEDEGDIIHMRSEARPSMDAVTTSSSPGNRT